MAVQCWHFLQTSGREQKILVKPKTERECGGNSKPFPVCFSDGAEEEKMETEAEGQPAEKVSLALLAGALWHFSPEFRGF